MSIGFPSLRPATAPGPLLAHACVSRGRPFLCFFVGAEWNNFRAFKEEEWLPRKPKRRPTNDL
jgi:hypothetical protein